jgi:hypothetical protein
VEQIVGALILAAGAFYGVWRGAVYAADRLMAQLHEERTLSDERLAAEAHRLQMQLDAEAQRLDKQLDTDAERLEQQLKAEAERLDKQLAHDRWMREVEELRRLIDEAAAAGLAAGNAIHAFRGPVRWAANNEGRLGATYLPAHQAATAAVQGMQGYVERLELRLDQGHAISTAYSAWQLMLEHAIDALAATPPTTEALTQAGTKLKESASQYLDFMSTARKYVQLEPPIDAVPF